MVLIKKEARFLLTSYGMTLLLCAISLRWITDFSEMWFALLCCLPILLVYATAKRPKIAKYSVAASLLIWCIISLVILMNPNLLMPAKIVPDPALYGFTRFVMPNAFVGLVFIVFVSGYLSLHVDWSIPEKLGANLTLFFSSSLTFLLGWACVFEVLSLDVNLAKSVAASVPQSGAFNHVPDYASILAENSTNVEFLLLVAAAGLILFELVTFSRVKNILTVGLNKRFLARVFVVYFVASAVAVTADYAILSTFRSTYYAKGVLDSKESVKFVMVLGGPRWIEVVANVSSNVTLKVTLLGTEVSPEEERSLMSSENRTVFENLPAREYFTVLLELESAQDSGQRTVIEVLRGRSFPIGPVSYASAIGSVLLVPIVYAVLRQPKRKDSSNL